MRPKGHALCCLHAVNGFNSQEDGRAFKTPVIVAKAQSTRNCQLAETQNGVVVNVKTRQAFSYADPCVELGPTIAYDEKAHAASLKAVKEFVAATLLRL